MQGDREVETERHKETERQKERDTHTHKRRPLLFCYTVDISGLPEYTQQGIGFSVLRQVAKREAPGSESGLFSPKDSSVAQCSSRT